MKKYILITGGELFNKGAEAMTFATVSEMKNKFPNKKVILLSSRDYKKSDLEKQTYKFDILPLENGLINMLLGGPVKIGWSIFRKIRKSSVNEYYELQNKFEEILSDTHAIIDISGYALSSQWGPKKSVRFLNRIKLAKKFNIPFYIMPQSIGPFNYDKYSQYFMDKYIKKNLKYSKVIFAREREGYEILVNKYKLTNVKYSLDLVLMNRETDLSNIYHAVPIVDDYDNIQGIGIAPNMRNFEHGNYDSILNVYKTIIDYLILKNKNIYLIKHASEDEEACKIIKDLYPNNEQVQLISEELKSYEFDSLVKKFDFLIGSRYHSIVHAYKNAIPCISLGWATKYHELLSHFEQEDYVFDVRNNLGEETILEAIEKMNLNFSLESKKIRRILEKTQDASKSVFDAVE